MSDKIDPLRAVQRKIADKKAALSAAQIKDFMSGQLDEKFRAILDEAFNAGVIEPNTALSELIWHVAGRESVYPIAIALRWGADPNLYLEDPNNRKHFHILTALRLRWEESQSDTDPRYLNMIVLLLLYYGSKPSSPHHDPGKGRLLDKEGPRSASRDSVLDWLSDNEHESALERAYPHHMETLDDASKTDLAILTGNGGLVKSSITGEQIEHIMMARTDKEPPPEGKERGTLKKSEKAERGAPSLASLDKEIRLERKEGSPSAVRTDNMLRYASLPSGRRGLDSSGIFWAVQNFSVSAVTFYSLQGYDISYPLLTTLLLRMERYRKRGDLVLHALYRRILEVLVKTGTALDIHQRNMLGAALGAQSGELEKIYQRPYWSKVCRRQHFQAGIPERLERLAGGFIEDPSESGTDLCAQLRKIADLDAETVVSSARERRKMLFNARHAYVQEIKTDKAPSLRCADINQADGDPLDYPDDYVASYRDGNGLIWCFMSPEFPYLLEKKTNPKNDAPLPRTFLETVARKRENLCARSLNPKKPQSYKQLVAELSAPDSFSDNISNEEMRKFRLQLQKVGVSFEDLQMLKRADIDRAASEGGYVGNLDRLTREHALTTLAYIVNFYKENDATKTALLLDRIVSKIRDAKEELYMKQKPTGSL